MRRLYRYLILAVMVVLTAIGAAMMPHININGDMTEYLPKDSQMRIGLDTLRRHFPLIDTNAPTIRVMFRTSGGTRDIVQAEATHANSPKADHPLAKAADEGLLSPDSLKVLLSRESGVTAIMGTRQKDSLALFELAATKDTDLEAVAQRIRYSYPGCLAAETNAGSNMPPDMIPILILAGVMILVILLAMCSSFVEALLFIVAIGMAVVINMGTNAFLPSVSMMTNTIVAVLQFVLSMDYSIILMNRYRMVLASESDPDRAMSVALRKASSSILSSSFTTIVGLLALVFMKFRIGMDLGIVLAKGVLCSLVSIYTVLPALILLCHKGITATQKKVPLIPTDRLAGFEVKYRYVLAVLFAAIFISGSILQKRTPLSYASVWESEISDEFPPQNAFMLLYRTAEEDKVISILDTIAKDKNVVTAVSYPSIMRRSLTAPQMKEMLGGMMKMLPSGTDIPVDSTMLSEGNIRMMYYAISHPVRDEKMSFAQIIALAEDASAGGMMSEGMMSEGMMSGEMDINSLMEQFNAPESVPMPAASHAAGKAGKILPAGEVPAGKPSAGDLFSPEPSEGENEPQTVDSEEKSLDTLATDVPDTTQLVPVLQPSGRFSYENCNEQMSASVLAAFLESGEGNTRAIFRMAGKKNGKMSPAQFVEFVNTKILPNKLMRAAISREQLEALKAVSLQIDSALAAGPSPLVQTADSLCVVQCDSPQRIAFQLASVAESDDNKEVEPQEQPYEETPMDRLAQMAFSGKSFTCDEVWNALHAAKIDISRDAVELMFTLYGSRQNFDEDTRLTADQTVGYLTGDKMRGVIASLTGLQGATDSLRSLIDGSLGQMRTERWSMAAVVTELPVESDSTFAFVDKLQSACLAVLDNEHFTIGEPVMYNEMKKGFSKELLFLTILTVASIFLIVAITFRSLVIPAILVLAVLTGVYADVFFSGVGGGTMLYLAYLIVQSILMGATIDYGILFTNFYRDFRRSGCDMLQAMKASYKGSIHTIMTSGLIMVCAPYVMSLALTDPALSSILGSLSIGALSAILVILLLVPGTLAACDRFVFHERESRKIQNSDK